VKASVISLIILSVIGFYFGIGGCLPEENRNEVSKTHDFNDTRPVIIGKVSYRNAAEYLLAQENDRSAIIFPWVDALPSFVANVITACSFGMLGGIISIIKRVALLKENLSDINCFAIPVLGFFTGLVVLGLNYIIPTILVSGNTQIRPISLLFLCLFAGVYANEFYSFLTKTIGDKVFNNKNAIRNENQGK